MAFGRSVESKLFKTPIGRELIKKYICRQVKDRLSANVDNFLDQCRDDLYSDEDLLTLTLETVFPISNLRQEIRELES